MTAAELIEQLGLYGPEREVCVIVGDCDDLQPVTLVREEPEDWVGPEKVLVVS